MLLTLMTNVSATLGYSNKCNFVRPYSPRPESERFGQKRFMRVRSLFTLGLLSS
jgi:hypothetical protein